MQQREDLDIRAAIILKRDLPVGAAVNAAAIAFADMGRLEPGLFGDEVWDLDGNRHASIRRNVVILKAGSGQLANFAADVLRNTPALRASIFSERGQLISNAFSEYEALISRSHLPDLNPIAVALVGPETLVREVTKKFSLLKDSATSA